MTGLDMLLEIEDKKLVCKILFNTKKHNGDHYIDILVEEYFSFGDFINSAFIWIDTQEGQVYWEDIYNNTIIEENIEL